MAQDLTILIETYVTKDLLCRNGYVINKWMEQGSNIRQTALKLMSIYPWELPELTVINRVTALTKKLKKLQKTVNTNWEALVDLLESPFPVTPPVTQKRKSGTLVLTQGGPSPKKQKMKSDCEKCPEYRALHQQKLIQKDQEHELQLRQMKTEFNTKNINRQKRDNHTAKKKLRSKVLQLKKEVRTISKENTKLELLVNMDIVDELKKQKAKTKKQQALTRRKEEELRQAKQEKSALKKQDTEQAEHFDYLQSLFEEQEEDNMVVQEVKTATKEGRSYLPEVRLCLHKCLQTGTPVTGASDLIRFVCATMVGVKLGPLPGPSTVAQCTYELGVISDIQVIIY